MISALLEIYIFILFARLILSWFPNPPEGLRPVYNILFVLTEPPLRLVRPWLPPLRVGMMALDLSPIILFVVLQILAAVLRAQGL